MDESIFSALGRAVSRQSTNQSKNENTDDELGVSRKCDSCCSCCKEMSYGERLFFCAICVVGGYILSFGSLTRFLRLMKGNPLPFVAGWTMGNVVSLAGSLFLKGPANQLQRMFHPDRIYATYAYLISLGFTAIISFFCFTLDHQTGLVLGSMLIILMVTQFLAITWYTLSYIPFAREFVKKIFCHAESSSSADSGPFLWWSRARRQGDYEEIL